MEALRNFYVEYACARSAAPLTRPWWRRGKWSRSAFMLEADIRDRLQAQGFDWIEGEQ